MGILLDGSDSTPTDIKEFVSTGSSMLDLVISNKLNGGIDWVESQKLMG